MTAALVVSDNMDLRCKRGDEDDVVLFVQQILRDVWHVRLDGDNGGVDGIFGPSTEAAVRQFQTANGINPTGVVDSKTSAALQNDNSLAVDEPHDHPAAPTKNRGLKAAAIAGGVGVAGVGGYFLGKWMRWW